MVPVPNCYLLIFCGQASEATRSAISTPSLTPWSTSKISAEVSMDFSYFKGIRAMPNGHNHGSVSGRIYVSVRFGGGIFEEKKSDTGHVVPNCLRDPKSKFFSFLIFIKNFLFVYTGTGIFLLQVCKTTIIWSLEISCLPKYSGAGPFLVNSELWLRRQVYK